MSICKVAYGRGEVEFEVDKVEVIDSPHPPDGYGVEMALKNPVSSPPLEHIIKGKSVGVVLPDITRGLFSLPSLIEKELECADDVVFVFALGLHRRMTSREIKKILGDWSDHEYLQHDVDDCEYIGKTTRGTPLQVFGPLMQFERVIAIGRIDYHYYAGYTGGYKSVLPGVSSRETILSNHSLMLEDGAVPGNIDSPVRKDIDECSRLFRLDFILNLIMSGNEVVSGVAGDAILAHRKGCEYLDRHFLLKCQKADVVIVSAGGYPKDINLFQAHKAVENIQSVVKEGGSIILVAECSEGLGNETFEEWAKMGLSPDDVLERLKGSFIMGAHKLARLALLRKKFNLFIVSSLPDELARACFFTPSNSVEEALREIAETRGAGERILVVKHGNFLLKSR